jgi:hypothetical protein
MLLTKMEHKIGASAGLHDASDKDFCQASGECVPIMRAASIKSTPNNALSFLWFRCSAATSFESDHISWIAC